jgi:hypothetical protein
MILGGWVVIWVYKKKMMYRLSERNIKGRSPENFFYITGQIFIAMGPISVINIKLYQ